MEGAVITFFADLLGHTNIVSVAALAVMSYMLIRKANMDSKTVHAAIDQKHINGLIKQIETLSDELHDAREELTRIHTLNMKLLEEISDANIRIRELEMMVNRLTNQTYSFNHGRRAEDRGLPPNPPSHFKRRSTDQ